MCKVYTGYYGKSEIDHGLCASTVKNSLTKTWDYLRTGAQTMLCLAKAWGLSLRTGTQIMLYHSLVPQSTDTQSLAQDTLMCMVYTGYCGTSEIEHGLCACMVNYLSVQAHKPCSISDLYHSPEIPNL